MRDGERAEERCLCIDLGSIEIKAGGSGDL